MHGMTMPVLADEGWAINNRYEKDGGIPTQILVAPGVELVKVDGGTVSEAEIEAVLPE